VIAVATAPPSAPSAGGGRIDHLSVSSIREMTLCPRRFHYRFRRRVQAEPEQIGAALVFGVAMHEALRAVHDAALAGTTDDRLAVFQRHWQAALTGLVPVTFGKDDAATLATKAERLLAAYTPPPGTVLAVEEELRVDLPELPLPLVGRVDLVMAEGERTVVYDCKTTSGSSLGDTDAIAFQLGVYRLGWPGAETAAITLAKTAKPRIGRVPVEPMPEAGVVRHIVEVHAAIAAGVRYANRGWGCATCPYAKRCHADG
jgi:hypothetical protein